MQHPYYQQPQQQQFGGVYFYQPQNDSSQAGAYGTSIAIPPTTPPTVSNSNNNNNNNNNNSNATTQFYNSAEAYHSPYGPPQFSPPHVMTVGVATPTALQTNSCASPKHFGVDSNTQSSQDSPSHRQHGQKALASSSSYTNTQQQQRCYAQQQPSAFPPPFQVPTFQPQSLQQRAQSPTVFRDDVPTVPPPQYQPPIYNQQHEQQIHSHGPAPSLLSTLLRGGFVSHILNRILPQDEFIPNASAGGPAVAESIPLHRVRFGHPEDDIPLLQELGIFPQHIRNKALAVLNPFKAMVEDVVDDTDLAGPVVFAITLAFMLSLRGKLQFSAIYSHSVLGILFTKVLLSLMTDRAVGLQFVVSALGYCLIPSVVLAVFQSLLYLLFGYLGKTLLLPALTIVLWSAWCATSMLVSGLSMERQRYLILYHMSLFYAVFAALTIF